METTLNGYVINKIEIDNWNPNHDYDGNLAFKYEEGTRENYYDISGDTDRLDRFLKTGSDIEKGNLVTKDNIMLEYWLTDTIEFYRDRYIGLMIK